jgi:hypothetical protein
MHEQLADQQGGADTEHDRPADTVEAPQISTE